MDEEVLVVLTGEELKAFRKQSDQDEEKLEHNLNLFLNWLSYQKHLPQNVDSNCIRNFIINCKGDIEKTRRKFECYWYSRVAYKEFLGDRVITLEGDLRCSEYIYNFALPKMTPDGCRIYVIKIFNMDIYELLPAARYFTILIDFLFHRDIVLAGQIVIFDMEIIKPNHYAKIFSAMLLKIIRLTFHMYPERMKRVILIACHPYLEKGINLCKSIMPQKIANRFVMVRDSRELQKLIPSSCLPSDYGGSLKSMKELSCLWQKHLIDSKELFETINRNIPTGPIPKEFVPLENEFGVHGSFRKLNID